MDVKSTLVRSIVTPVWAAWERSPYLRSYYALKRRQYDSSALVRDRQIETLRSIMRHALDRSQFWQGRLNVADVRRESSDFVDQFAAIPLLTKSDLREHGESMICSGFERGQLRHKKTSGSTGVSVSVWVDEDAMQWKRACTLRSDEWSGWRLGERKAMVWGNPEYLKRGWRGRLRNRCLERECYLDTLKMDAAAMRRFLDEQRQRPPSLLFGHAHSLFLLANFAERDGGAGFTPRGIISTAMVLHEHERRCIERVFGCSVTNRYGCEEVSLIACECEYRNGLHINADGVYVEVVRPDGSPAEPGETGAIVVTDLANRAMPILRYQVGDMGVISERQCPCGRGLPILERIEGRVADYVVTPTGELVSGISLTENFAMLVKGIEQLQIVQETVCDFVFRIVRGPDFDVASEAQLRSLVVERFGTQTRHSCEYVSRIPQEPSGKYRFCISKVQNPYSQLGEKAGVADGREVTAS